MGPIKKPNTQKWDSEALRMKKPRTKREKLAVLKYYETKMADGCDRISILGKLEEEFSVSSRQVERILNQARQYVKEIKNHHAQIAATALKLGEILDYYFKHQQFTITPLISSDFPYSALTPESPALNKRELENLAAHLNDDIPELIPILEYAGTCKQWFAIGDQKWEKEEPSITITGDLILKLKVRANQMNSLGKCQDYPR